MFETPYYHSLIKQAVIGFGALFSQLKVIRRNPNNSEATPQVVVVPIAYAPKEKFLVRLEQDPDQTGHTYITLPRMAFEVTGYSYDSSRMVSRNNKIQCKNTEDNSLTMTYTPVPYNIDFSLYVLTKGTEDGLAIIEQILPLFTPEYSLTVNAIPELHVKQDIPIILNSVSVSDDYEGDFAIRRLVTHTLTFTAKINLFGNIQTNGVIKRTDADMRNFQTHTAVMDDDGNIIVDTWNEVASRFDLERNATGELTVESSTELNLGSSFEVDLSGASSIEGSTDSDLSVDTLIELEASENSIVDASGDLTIE
jgi:hypothetical protein